MTLAPGAETVTDGEKALALDLLGCLGPGMLVLADRNSQSWSLARAANPGPDLSVAKRGRERPTAGPERSRRC